MSNVERFLQNLPKRVSGKPLENQSIRALENVLSDEHFIVRDVRICDYGVDLTLEVQTNDSPTNFTADVQVKGRSSITKLRDGSYSIPIEHTNINYLLNGNFALYILYVESSEEQESELRYVWAWDLFEFLNREKPNWQTDSGTTNVHFAETLTAASIPAVKARIIAHGASGRSINERIFSSDQQSVLISVDRNTLEVEDPEEIKAFLLSKGIARTISGFGQDMLERFNLLDAEARQQPEMQVLLAVINLEQAQFQRVKEILSPLRSGEHNLNKKDSLLVDFMRAHANFETGATTHEALLAELKRVADDAEKNGIRTWYDFRMNYLRRLIGAEEDLVKRRQYVQEMKDHALSAKEKTLVDFRNIGLALEQEGDLLVLEFSDALRTKVLESRESMNRFLVDHNAKFDKWEKELISLTIQAQDPLFFADATCMMASVLVMLKGSHLILKKHPYGIAFIPSVPIEQFMRQILCAIEVYKQQGRTNQQLRATNYLAELTSFDETSDASDDLFNDVISQAQDFNYYNIQKHAESPVLTSIRTMIESRDKSNRKKETRK